MHGSAPNPPADPPSLSLGWDADDVRRLDELADVAMDLARTLQDQVRAHAAAAARGDASPLSAAESARIVRSFIQIARCVRLTLTLKAYVRGGEGAAGGTRPLVVRIGAPAEPNTVLAAESSTEAERLTEPREREASIAREREGEIFVFATPNDAIQHVCRELGVTLRETEDGGREWVRPDIAAWGLPQSPGRRVRHRPPPRPP